MVDEPSIFETKTVYVRFADVDAEWLRLNKGPGSARGGLTQGVGIGALAVRLHEIDTKAWTILRIKADMVEKRYVVTLGPRMPDDEDIIAELG